MHITAAAFVQKYYFEKLFYLFRTTFFFTTFVVVFAELALQCNRLLNNKWYAII